MYRSVRTASILALWGMFSLVAVQAQNSSFLLPGDETEWKPFGRIDPWSLPPNVTQDGDNDGAVYLGSAGGDQIGCGIVPYDRDNDPWMIPAEGDEFESVGYILPHGEYNSTSDNSFADCALRTALEEGKAIINKDSLRPLGLSNNGAVYWFRGTIIDLDRSAELPDNSIRWFSVAKARNELKNPRDDPKKKAEMRMALLNAQSLSRPRSRPIASSK